MRIAGSFPFSVPLLFALISLSCLSCSAPRSDIPQPVGGLLDLRTRNFDNGESVPLTGLWDFLPGSVDISYENFAKSHPVLRKVPDLWKDGDAGGEHGHGSGTYHLTVLLPPGTPLLALHYLSASTAFRIEVQGKTVVQIGVPSADPRIAKAAYKPGFVRLDSQGERMDIMIRVSNYVYRSGGLWYPIFLGSAESVESVHLTELAVALLQSMALGVMSLLLLLLFYLRRRDRAFLYSGLLAFLLALRVLVTGQYLITSILPGLPFDLMIRIEYLTVFIAFPVAIAFFNSLFPHLMKTWLKALCMAPPLGFSALVFILPLDLLTRSLFGFYCFAFLDIIILVVTLFLKTVLKGDVEGIAIFIGAAILGTSVVNDVFYSSFVWWTGNLAPWGFSVFVGFQVVIMVKRMTTAFAGVEELLVQKELLIKEVHHRVKNSLQVVASLLSLQSNRVDDPETKAVFSALRLRIVSMSLVHEKLYGKVASDSLDLGDYLQDLVRLLVYKDNIEAGAVNLKIETSAFQIDADRCFDVGLIVTELVSNAIKHSILPRGGGDLSVRMTGEKSAVSIMIEDDGPGFPPGFDPGKVDSLGYKLIANLVKRGRGRLEILTGPGGRVRFELDIGV